MTDENKTKPELIAELQALRLRVEELTRSETERQRVEAALRESEEHYRNLVDNATVGVYRTNLKGDILYVNDAIVKMFGFDSAEEMIAGGVLVRYGNQNDRKILLEELTKKGKVDNFALEVLTKAEETKNILLSATLEGNTHSGMAIDITERKRAEVLLQSVFDNLPIGIYITQDGKIQLVNPQLAKIIGRSQAEIFGRKPLPAIFAEDKDTVRENAVKMLHGERTAPYEYRLVGKDGKVRWVVETVASIQYQGRRAVMGSSMDITEHKQAEKALMAQKELTDRFLASTPNAVLVVDRDLDIVLANQMFFKTFNMTMAEVAGKQFNAVLNVEGLAEAVTRGLVDRQFQPDGEFRYETERGAMILLTQIVPMGDEEVLLILRDVTAERARQEQLKHVERLASIGEMAAGVAHELNNPLTSVVGYSELLLSRQVPQDMQTDIEVIHRNAQRAINIVRSLLAFSRRQELKKQRLSINDTIRQVLEIRGYQLKVSNIKVVTELATGLPDVLADAQQLEQVFLNIIVNAEQAMLEAHNRGTLTIRTGAKRGVVIVVLSDDGPGIPAENIWRVFNPFFTTKEPGKGTGLGLSICHGIITEHGGRIYAESKVGEGATFFIELPVAEAEVGAP